jgi:hypothetical protein
LSLLLPTTAKSTSNGTKQAIKSADLGDRDVQRLILGVMVGNENVSLSHGGTSKSSMNKANATAGIAANSLTKMLTMNNPSSFADVQQNVSSNAAKRSPPV